MEPIIESFYAHFIATPLRVERSYPQSVTGGAGGFGTRISTDTKRPGGSFGGGFDYQSYLDSSSGLFSIGNEKAIMQHLNDRLASYMETVRTLEKANQKLEIKIRKKMENSGLLEEKDFNRHNTIILDLRAKIFDMLKGKANLSNEINNAYLASEDFRGKLEYEMYMRQAVEADVGRLRKILDETNLVRLYLENDVESLKEELITLNKNHKENVADMQAQITNIGVQVNVDTPKGQDLAKIMEEMRAKYERIALKNHEELQRWLNSKMTVVKVQVDESTAALKEATTEVRETRRIYQSKETELQSHHYMKSTLVATLRDMDHRYNMEMEKYNKILLGLKEQLTGIRNDILKQTQEYEILLNIKIRLDAEIIEYRRLLDGDAGFNLQDALQTKVKTTVLTVTQNMVDGKVVSESKGVKMSDKVVESKMTK